MADTFLLNSPLINYFHYSTGDNVGQLADAGTIEFFEAADHSVQQDTFTDPEGAVPNDNPIELTAVGSWPPIYMKDAEYYVEIKDKNGNLIETLDNYQPNGGSGVAPDPTKENANMFANGQFQYQTDFSKDIDEAGVVKDSSVIISKGWGFVTDTGTTTKNKITFEDIGSETIEANPNFQLVLDSSEIMAGETQKEIYQTVGESVYKFDGETFTFSMQAINKSSGTVPVEIRLYKNYGAGGSPPDDISLVTFNVTTTRTKYIHTFTFPSSAGKTIGIGSLININVRMAVGQVCSLGLTNMLLLEGSVSDPVFPNVSYSKGVSSAFAQDLDLRSGYDYNYFPYATIGSVSIPTSNVGTMVMETIGKQQANQHRCDGTSLKVSDYTIPVISNRRLYNVIGNTYGTSGDIVVTSAANIVKVDSAVGGRELSPYTAGTLGAKVTVTNTIIGLKAGFSVTVAGSVATATFVEAFAPDPTPAPSAPMTSTGIIGTWYKTVFTPPSPAVGSGAITTATVTAGPSPLASSSITFTSNTISDYKSILSPVISGDPQNIYINFLECSSFLAPTTRAQPWNDPGQPLARTPGPIHIAFSVDGVVENYSGSEQTVIVPFISTDTLTKNLQVFETTINNPFEWTITFVTVPAASEYFEASSETVGYYIWYTVDAVGVDPAIVGRTGINVVINSTDTTTLVATKTAAAMNSLEFSLPDETIHLPVIPAAGIPKLAWYING